MGDEHCTHWPQICERVLLNIGNLTFLTFNSSQWIVSMFLCCDSEQNMSMILGIGPALGFFLVPVIGRASDRCRSSLGRRRPFIFILSVLLVLSLFVIPYAEAVCSSLFGHSTELTSTLSVTTMVVGAVILDFSCQTCLTPCEALLSDLR